MSAKKKAVSKVAKRAKAVKSPKKKAGATRAPAAAARGKSASKKPVSKKAAGTKAVAKKAVAKKASAKKAVAKKPVTTKSAKAKPTTAKAATPSIKRRDGAGHLDPKYAADLRALVQGRPKDDEQAFGADALSQELGEEFVETVTSGEDEGTEIRDERVTEELGGPFTVTTGGTEFANGVDGSNPKRATREPFPRT
jgi:hypothetical protein